MARADWPSGLLVLAIVVAGTIAVALTGQLLHKELSQPWRLNFEDLQIYRQAAQVALSGQNVYLIGLSSAHLPFTYPPFALLAVSWLDLLPLHAAQVAAILASLAMLGACCAVLAREGVRRLGPERSVGSLRGRRLGTVAVGVVLFAIAVYSEPVRSTLGFGQINLFLMALVLVDAFVVPPRFRGILTGVAAAIKLTPAIFIGYYAVSGQRRAAVAEVAAAAVASLLTAVVLPRESWLYWSSLIWKDRQGPTTFADNQNWTGMITRLFGHHAGAEVAVVALDGLSLAVALLATRRAWAAGRPLSALAAVAVTGLLLSPISWSHHWVWIVAVIAALVLENPFRGAPLAALATLVLFHVALQHRLAGRNARAVHWNWWQTIAGNSYTLVGFAFLVAVALLTRPGRRSGVT